MASKDGIGCLSHLIHLAEQFIKNGQVNMPQSTSSNDVNNQDIQSNQIHSFNLRDNFCLYYSTKPSESNFI